MKSACGWRALLCLATFRAQSDVNIRVTSFVSCKIDKVTPVIVQLSEGIEGYKVVRVDVEEKNKTISSRTADAFRVLKRFSARLHRY